MRENMFIKLSRAILLLSLIGLVVACGTMARPVFEAPEEVEVVEADVQNVDSGDEVAVVPTETPQPPTATPTDEPTATIELPTETPTEEPTSAPVDPIARLVASRDPANGEVLFNEFYPQTGFACATCHHVAQEGQLIGPTMLNIKDIAGTRVEGEGVERYLYNSIVNPNDYVVEGFVPGVMPQIWGEIMSDTEIYDVIAYLLTLEG